MPLKIDDSQHDIIIHIESKFDFYSADEFKKY